MSPPIGKKAKDGDPPDRWESLAELATWLRTAGAHGYTAGERWAGATRETALHALEHGDPSITAATIAGLDRESTITGSPAWVWQSDVRGSRVDVGAYLRGDPRSMRRRVRGTSDVRHLTIAVNVVSGADVRVDLLQRRGCAILALIEHLYRSGVAVDLWVCASVGFRGNSGTYSAMVRVETRPLDLSSSAWAIAHPAMARQLLYSLSYIRGQNSVMVCWPSRVLERDEWGLTDAADLYVAPARGDDDLLHDPERWVRERVRDVTGYADEERAHAEFAARYEGGE